MIRFIDDSPRLTGANTQAQVFKQGVTYSEAGVTYSKAGVKYGGVFNPDEDVIPVMSSRNVYGDVPMIANWTDQYTPGAGTTTGNSGMILGPGLPWQFLTYP